VQAELLRVSSHEELLQAWLQQEEVQPQQARLLVFQRERVLPQEPVLPTAAAGSAAVAGLLRFGLAVCA
jgi:hypothetical protein